MTEARSPRGGRVEAAALERELTDAALAGAGRIELLQRLRRATGRHVRLVGPDGAPLATTDGGAGLPPPVAQAVLDSRAGPGVDTVDGDPVTALAVRAGATVAGVLLTVGPADPAVQALAAGAVTALLIDSVRGAGPSVAASPSHSPADVVAALRCGTVTPSVYAAAAALAIDLRRPPAGAVLRYAGTRLRAWSTALTWLEHPVQQEGRSAWTVVANDLVLADLQDRLQLMVGDEAVIATSGSRPETAAGLPRSFTEAARLLELAGMRGAARLTFDGSGVLQLLLPVPNPRLEAYVEAHLGPIRHRPELMATLRAWLAESGSRQSVSEQLHLHRNSVGYRVRQIKNLLGVDPLEPAASAELQLALAALDLLAADQDASGH
jgi:hypothetical protein